MSGPRDLIRRWCDHAALMRTYRAEQEAAWLEDRAAELEAALATHDSGLVCLTEAAQLSGYSADHLGRLLREGKIPNGGRRGAPLIRRCDVPTRPPRSPIVGACRPSYDADADARSILSRRGDQ